MNALARLGWIICLAVGISTAIVFSDGLIPLFIKAGVLAFAVSLIGMSALLVVVEYRREEEDRKHQRTIELARLPRRAVEPQTANPAPARPALDEGCEIPTPSFLDRLFDYLAQNKTDQLPPVRSRIFHGLELTPASIQAMFKQLQNWGAIVERTERGASGRMVWDIVQCRRYMIAERPDYAPTLTVSGDIKNTHAV